MDYPENKCVEQWWIPGILPKYRLTLLAAMGGTGKTSLAAYLAKTLIENKGTRIAYWSFEDTPQDFTNKIGKINGLFFIHEAKDMPLDFTKEEDITMLNNFLYDNGIDILIIDPISAFLSGDTNDNQKVRMLLNPLLKMTEDIGITILGIHHFRKEAKMGGSVRGSIMGASAWVDSARHVLSLVKNEHDQRFLEVAKSNITKTGIAWEVFTEVNLYGAFCVTGIEKTDDNAAQLALESPDKKKLPPVIENLKSEFDIGQKFNLDDVDRLGNRKTFYNWIKNKDSGVQACDTKKDGKKAYIFI